MVVKILKSRRVAKWFHFMSKGWIAKTLDCKGTAVCMLFALIHQWAIWLGHHFVTQYQVLFNTPILPTLFLRVSPKTVHHHVSNGKNISMEHPVISIGKDGKVEISAKISLKHLDPSLSFGSPSNVHGSLRCHRPGWLIPPSEINLDIDCVPCES